MLVKWAPAYNHPLHLLCQYFQQQRSSESVDVHLDNKNGALGQQDTGQHRGLDHTHIVQAFVQATQLKEQKFQHPEMGTFIAALFIKASIWEPPTCTAQWNDKEMQYICKIEPKVAPRLSDLEPNSILSKIYQT